MSSSEEQTKQSCKTMVESKKLPKTQKPSGSRASYSQIRYLMKRLNTALNKRLREGRPSKFCRVCREKLRSISRELPEKKKKSPVKHRQTSKKPNLRKTRTKPVTTVVLKAPDYDESHHSLVYHRWVDISVISAIESFQDQIA